MAASRSPALSFRIILFLIAERLLQLFGRQGRVFFIGDAVTRPFLTVRNDALFRGLPRRHHFFRGALDAGGLALQLAQVI